MWSLIWQPTLLLCLVISDNHLILQVIPRVAGHSRKSWSLGNWRNLEDYNRNKAESSEFGEPPEIKLSDLDWFINEWTLWCLNLSSLKWRGFSLLMMESTALLRKEASRKRKYEHSLLKGSMDLNNLLKLLAHQFYYIIDGSWIWMFFCSKSQGNKCSLGVSFYQVACSEETLGSRRFYSQSPVLSCFLLPKLAHYY